MFVMEAPAEADEGAGAGAGADALGSSKEPWLLLWLALVELAVEEVDTEGLMIDVDWL